MRPRSTRPASPRSPQPSRRSSSITAAPSTSSSPTMLPEPFTCSRPAPSPPVNGSRVPPRPRGIHQCRSLARDRPQLLDQPFQPLTSHRRIHILSELLPPSLHQFPHIRLGAALTRAWHEGRHGPAQVFERDPPP